MGPPSAWSVLPALIAVLIGVAAAPGKAAASPADLYYERVLMTRADRRCHLFQPDLAHALDAAALQARGAALRAGSSEADLAQIADRARSKADSVSCGAGDLATAAARVKAAFKGYAALRSLTFPGVRSAWFADREALILSDRRPPRFVLIQTFKIDGRPAAAGYVSGLGFGVAIGGETASGFAAARLVLRDPALSPKPALQAGLAPPATRSFLARDIRPLPRGLLSGAEDGTLVLFADPAADALSGLDPRESGAVELARPTGDRRRPLTGVFEVGDFAAARAFLAVGRR